MHPNSSKPGNYGCGILIHLFPSDSVQKHRFMDTVLSTGLSCHCVSKKFREEVNYNYAKNHKKHTITVTYYPSLVGHTHSHAEERSGNFV